MAFEKHEEIDPSHYIRCICPSSNLRAGENEITLLALCGDNVVRGMTLTDGAYKLVDGKIEQIMKGWRQ